MKAVVFYESADDVAAKACPHVAAHSARWKEFADRGELLMIGPFANAIAGLGRDRLFVGWAGGSRVPALPRRA